MRIVDNASHQLLRNISNVNVTEMSAKYQVSIELRIRSWIAIIFCDAIKVRKSIFVIRTILGARLSFGRHDVT